MKTDIWGLLYDSPQTGLIQFLLLTGKKFDSVKEIVSTIHDGLFSVQTTGSGGRQFIAFLIISDGEPSILTRDKVIELACEHRSGLGQLQAHSDALVKQLMGGAK